MSSQNDSYIVAKMTKTVVIVPIDGINLKDKKERDKIDAKVEVTIKEIVNKLKATHEKFEDPDFGPREKDEYGAVSFYGNAPPDPAGSKYPKPETLKWERPRYDDTNFLKPAEAGGDDTNAVEEEEEEDEWADSAAGGDEDDEIWCKHGQLFLDGSSSGDVIQGQLGDCWFLSALAVMGANENLLDKCFWKKEQFQEYGFYVLQFYKDCNMVFVVVDDRIPVKAKDGRPIFANNKDPNELWVPLIEKGYAKLHGCYKALIGGFTHFGLADMTGYCPRLIVTKEGYLGYTDEFKDKDEELWSTVLEYKKRGCLMGTSIQSNPKEKAKIEADAGHGLHMGHAYSLLDLAEVDTPGYESGKTRLMKLRNPWGRGEWEGRFGDRSDEWDRFKTALETTFNTANEAERVEQNFNDGTFFIPFDDWKKHFTNLFVALNFPENWVGRRIQGTWTGETGGNRDMGTWRTNTKIHLKISKPNPATAKVSKDGKTYVEAFVGLYIKDSRLVMGFNYFKDPLYATPLSFDIVTAEDFDKEPKERAMITQGLIRDMSGRNPAQPPYNFGTTQIELMLEAGKDYFIVPSLYRRGQKGTYFLQVYADAQEMKLGEGTTGASGSAADAAATVAAITGYNPNAKMMIGKNKDVALKMSVAQFYEKKETLRERLVSEAKRLGLSVHGVKSLFVDAAANGDMILGTFKRRMMEKGFSLAEFPDDDLVVLDKDNDGTISTKEFMDFFEEGWNFVENGGGDETAPVEQPVDDMLYKAIDLEGELSVKVIGARYVREVSTWFNNPAVESSVGNTPPETAEEKAARSKDKESTAKLARKVVKYDPKAAAELHARTVAERKHAEAEALINAMRESEHAPASEGRGAADNIKSKSKFILPEGCAVEFCVDGKGDEWRLGKIKSNAKFLGSGFYDIEYMASVGTRNQSTKQITLKGDQWVRKYEESDGNDTARARAAQDVDVEESGDSFASPFASPQKSVGKFAKSGSLSLTEGALQSHNSGMGKKTPKNGVAASVVSHGAMSINTKEQLDKAGRDAASKLHSDPNLMRAEVSRTCNLGSLRKAKKDKQAASAEPGVRKVEEGVLRKKTKPKKKILKRDIMKDIETLAYLSYWPEGIEEVIGRSRSRHGGGSSATDVPTAVRQPSSFAISDATNGGAVGGASDESKTMDGIASLVAGAGGDSTKITPRAGKRMSVVGKSLVPIEPPPPKPEPSKSTASSVANSRPCYFIDVEEDLWDHIIDCVLTISTSRAKTGSSGDDRHTAMRHMKHKVNGEAFGIFSAARTPIPVPSRLRTPKSAQKGHAPMSRNGRKTPGTASVRTAQGGAALQRAALLEGKHQLHTIAEEQSNTYEEIYRRLVAVPTVTYAELEGERHTSTSGLSLTQTSGSKTYLKSLFKRFDKNLNGLISVDEFQLAMKELNIDVSDEDCEVFFHRFSTKDSGGIDWREFIEFFTTEIIGSTREQGEQSTIKNLVALISKMREVLGKVIRYMRENGLSTLFQYFMAIKSGDVPEGGGGASGRGGKQAILSTTTGGGGEKQSKKVSTNFELPSNAVFQNLNVSDNTANTRIMKKLGLDMAEDDFARIARVFDHSVKLLMDFCTPAVHKSSSQSRHRGADSVSSSDVAAAAAAEEHMNGVGGASSLLSALDMLDKEVAAAFAERSGLTADGMKKLWTTMAPNLDAVVYFEDISKYLYNMLRDSINAGTFTKSAVVSNLQKMGSVLPMAAVAAASDEIALPESAEIIVHGLPLNVLCRLVADTLIYSSWNKSGVAAAGKVGGGDIMSALSFSGLDAYLRNERINAIERKMKYLMQLESNSSSSSINLLVHVYLSRAKDELIVLAHDTLSGDVYKVNVKEDLSALPTGADKEKLFVNHKRDSDFSMKLRFPLCDLTYNPKSVDFYNPWDTPAEDAAISEFVDRLRLVRARSAVPTLILAEEPKFVHQLKTLFDGCSSHLPFFCVLNEMTLSMQVDIAQLKDESSIRSLVFGKLRSSKVLYNFMINVTSSLTVVLSTYNAGIRESFKWTEMLAHLLNYRNPFVSLQLLPKFVEPEEYIYRPVEDNTAFTGEDEVDPVAVKRSRVELDGCPHPQWNESFRFDFRPPKITNCKVVSHDIAKMLVDDKMKYVVIMVRESKMEIENRKKVFRFCTIYDSRTATEYQCGVKKGCRLYDSMHPPADPNQAAASDVVSYISKLTGTEPDFMKQNKKEVDDFCSYVEEATEGDFLILGPSITPRLVIKVYNQNGKKEELLGACETSVSSVLSGSGLSDPQWVTLTHKIDKDCDGGTSKTVSIKAGDIRLELGFRKMAEIEAEQEAKKQQLMREEARARALARGEEPDAIGKKRLLTGPGGGDQAAGGGGGGSGMVSPRAGTPAITEFATEKKAREKAVREAVQAKEEELQAKNFEVQRMHKEVERLKKALAAGGVVGVGAAAATTGEGGNSAGTADAETVKQLESTLANNKKLEDELALLRKEVEATKAKAKSVDNVRTGGESTDVAAAAAASTSSAEADAALTAKMAAMEMDTKKKLEAAQAAIAAAQEEAAAAKLKAAEAQEAAELAAAAAAAEKEKSSKSSATGGGATDAAAVDSSRVPSSSAATGDIAYAKVSGDETANDVMSGIVETLYGRHMHVVDGSKGHLPLKGFKMMLSNGYASPDGYVQPKDFINALADIMISVSTEQAQKVFRDLGSNPQKGVLATKVVEMAEAELKQIQNKNKKLGKAASKASGVLDGGASLSDPQQQQPKTMLSGDAKDTAFKPLPKRPQSAAPSAATAAPYSPAPPSMERTKSAGAGRPQPGASSGAAAATAAATSGAAAPSPGRKAKKDWSKVPLPKNWERIPGGGNNGRDVYINHNDKTTHWFHPDDAASEAEFNARKAAKKAAKLQGGGGGMNSTQPVLGSGAGIAAAGGGRGGGDSLNKTAPAGSAKPTAPAEEEEEEEGDA